MRDHRLVGMGGDALGSLTEIGTSFIANNGANVK